jgi:hypothetical protein
MPPRPLVHGDAHALSGSAEYSERPPCRCSFGWKQRRTVVRRARVLNLGNSARKSRHESDRTKHWTLHQVEGIESGEGLVLGERPMEARIARLEAENHRLRSDIESLKNAVWLLEQRTKTDPLKVATIITAVAAALIWFG